MTPRVLVDLDHGLAEVLVSALQRALGAGVDVEAARLDAAMDGDVVVVSQGDVRAQHVKARTQDGVLTVVMAAVPSADRRDEFRRSGAAGYLPMEPDISELVEALRPLLWPGRTVLTGR